MKTIKALVKELAKREGLKKQVDIAQITEIVGHLGDIFDEQAQDGYSHNDAFMLLHELGYKRRLKRERKTKKLK